MVLLKVVVVKFNSQMVMMRHVCEVYFVTLWSALERAFGWEQPSIKQEQGMRPTVDAAMHTFKQANHLVNLSMGYEPVHVRQRYAKAWML